MNGKLAKQWNNERGSKLQWQLKFFWGGSVQVYISTG